MFNQQSHPNPLRKTRSAKAGIHFPVSRIHRGLRQQRGYYIQQEQHVGTGAPVYLAAVLEYLMAEILELAGNAAHADKKSCIASYHLQLTIRNDQYLKKLVNDFTIAHSGGHPIFHSNLFPVLKRPKMTH
ncbi:histone-fold-containing protein [Phascolomyces articulosus]|uniref:Histone H2A n=1 Tax=Phascolomyces articulosus TaxID=60185 RepID=A0AAD5K340_9FUNG|nr:histone-fold-containing protein [Phascolomyces articulosus]